MRNPLPHILLSLLLLAGFACQGGRESLAPFWAKIDSIMPTRPDSALRLLRDKANERFTKADRARYLLLRTEAEDKTYVTPTTDSLIAIAAHYYEESDNERLKAKAWYYMGRVNQELKRPLLAQDYYLKALRHQTLMDDHALLGRVCNHLGMLYTYQDVYERAIPYQKEAIRHFALIGDSTGQAFATRDLARNFHMTNQPDSAIFYYRLAEKRMGSRAIQSIYAELGSLCTDIGRYDEAASYLRKVREEEGDFSYDLIRGQFYLETNRLDSAEFYLRPCLSNGKTKAAATYYLAHLAYARADYRACAELQRAYEILQDSIVSQTQTESIRKTEALYRHQEMRQALNEQALLIAHREKERYLYALLCVLLALACLALHRRWRNAREAAQRREEEMVRTFERQRQSDRRQIADNERQIATLRDQIDRLDNERATKWERQKLQLEKQLLETSNALLSNEEERRDAAIAGLLESDVYKRFHDKPTQRPRSEDWEALERLLDETYNQFTNRLKELAPLSDVEIKACQLTKISLSANQITNTLNYNSSVLRKRIYKKLFQREGTVEDLKRFIEKF